MVKYAAIKKANYTPEKVNEYLRNPDTVTVNGEEWVTWLIGFFDSQTGDFDIVFKDREEFVNWQISGIDKTIHTVKYDWSINQVSISITFRPDVFFDFEARQNMAEADCVALIEGLTNNDFKAKFAI